MKKLFFFVFVLLQSIFTFGQLKVFSTGKTLIGGTTGTVNGDIQFNLWTGSSHGLTFYNPSYSQSYRLTTNNNQLLLSYNNLSLGYYLSGFYVGGNNSINEYGGSLNVCPVGGNYYPFSLVAVANQSYNMAIYARNDYSAPVGAGISILSKVGKSSDIPFAGGLTSSAYSFYVLGDGTVYTPEVVITSDDIRRTDIANITSPLSKLLNLHAVEYRLFDENSDTLMAKKFQDEPVDNTIQVNSRFNVPTIDPEVVKVIEKEQSEGKHIGFLAQEVEKVLPEVVRTSVNGTKAISYIDIIALLVEGIKEQQQTIETMQNEMTELKKSISNRESHNNRANIKKEYIGARLYQNTPNPFSKTTEIGYFLPEQIRNAFIYIYNMNGTQIAGYSLTDKGEGTLTIDANTLTAGMYLYSLIADDKVVDTKRMILTK